MRNTSLLAYFHGNLDSFPKCRRMVFEYIVDHPGVTDKQISVALGIPINSITPRRNELEALNLIESIGVERCAITGRKAHVWRIKNE